MTLISFRLFRKHLGNLRDFFWQMVYRPPWPKSSRTPMTVSDTITVDNIPVQQAEGTKFLGVLLDQHLSWKYHIYHVAKKVSKTIGIISKARFFLSSQSLLSLY